MQKNSNESVYNSTADTSVGGGVPGGLNMASQPTSLNTNGLK